MVRRFEITRYWVMICAVVALTSSCFTLWADARYVTKSSDASSEARQQEALAQLDKRLSVIESQNAMIIYQLRELSARLDKFSNKP